jgi:hypothetical protein
MDGTNGAWMLKSYKVAHYTIASHDNAVMKNSRFRTANVCFPNSLEKVALL